MGKKMTAFVALALVAGAAIFFASRSEGDHARQSIPRGFIGTSGHHFILDHQVFRFVGANVAVMYRDDERAQMPETLRQAAQDGIRVVRVWASGEGGESGIKSVGTDARDWPHAHPFRFAPDEWNEEAFAHLDRVLAEAARDNLRVQLCLVNWWRDTGGITQYLAWAGITEAADARAPYGINMERAVSFYTNAETRRLYREHVARIVSRRNSITGVLYRDDPTIFGYELMNEAQCPTGRYGERRAWIAEMSAYIKSLDPNHLVTPGTWGYRTAFERREWLKDHSLPDIDYCDAHNYPRDDKDVYVDSPDALRSFVDNRAAAAFSVNKPLVFGEFGINPEGYNGFSQAVWFKSYFEAAAQDGAGGAMFWIFTPDAERGYGVTYTTPRDTAVRGELRRAARLFDSPAYLDTPSSLLYSGRHLIPRQFQFAREEHDAATLPLILARDDGATILYRFQPEAAARARFEKLGGDIGYIWGAGAGFFEYVVPPREGSRKIKEIQVRAHLQPVLPHDAADRVRATSVTLFINGTNCGSRVVPVEDPAHALTQEWRVTSLYVRAQAALGKPLVVRFAVEVNADQMFGLNISGYPQGYDARGATPIEVLIK
ncbi:MAG: cellulase family glycosylhydrolase [Pyrinomonadaceae bacterium]